ncbi:MAG: Vms1/Ankzf1 family peptidyl-tRNA hydrolase [Halobacteriales archaeon]
MLDELLGRAELKERIETLETERDRLEEQLEAERERRAEAARARQDAEERINRLEDRIADLEGQLEHAEEGSETIDYRMVDRIRGGRLDAVLRRLERFEADSEACLTAMIEDGSDLPQPVRTAFGDRVALVARAAPCLAMTDDAGLISAAIEPPLAPDPFLEWAESFRLDRDWFRPSDDYAVALVRSDLFAYGEFIGQERTAFEGFETDVQSQHSKGGYSQGRFERRRDEQIDAHLDRCHEVLDERDPLRLFVVGERTVLDAFEDRADRTRTVDATGSPEAALEDAVRSLFTATLYRI